MVQSITSLHLDNKPSVKTEADITCISSADTNDTIIDDNEDLNNSIGQNSNEGALQYNMDTKGNENESESRMSDDMNSNEIAPFHSGICVESESLPMENATMTEFAVIAQPEQPHPLSDHNEVVKKPPAKKLLDFILRKK